MLLQSLLVLSIFIALSCLTEDVFVRRRHSHSSVFADLTNMKHLSYTQNLDDEEDDGTGATGVSAFDTSRLGVVAV